MKSTKSKWRFPELRRLSASARTFHTCCCYCCWLESGAFCLSGELILLCIKSMHVSRQEGGGGDGDAFAYTYVCEDDITCIYACEEKFGRQKSSDYLLNRLTDWVWWSWWCTSWKWARLLIFSCSSGLEAVWILGGIVNSVEHAQQFHGVQLIEEEHVVVVVVIKFRVYVIQYVENWTRKQNTSYNRRKIQTACFFRAWFHCVYCSIHV